MPPAKNAVIMIIYSEPLLRRTAACWLTCHTHSSGGNIHESRTCFALAAIAALKTDSAAEALGRTDCEGPVAAAAQTDHVGCSGCPAAQSARPGCLVASCPAQAGAEHARCGVGLPETLQAAIPCPAHCSGQLLLPRPSMSSCCMKSPRVCSAVIQSIFRISTSHECRASTSQCSFESQPLYT